MKYCDKCANKVLPTLLVCPQCGNRSFSVQPPSLSVNAPAASPLSPSAKVQSAAQKDFGSGWTALMVFLGVWGLVGLFTKSPMTTLISWWTIWAMHKRDLNALVSYYRAFVWFTGITGIALTLLLIIKSEYSGIFGFNALGMGVATLITLGMRLAMLNYFKGKAAP